VGALLELASPVGFLPVRGFRVVIALRFGDIFRGNALNDGLPVELELPIAERLWDADHAVAVTVIVELMVREVRTAEETRTFWLDDVSRWRLLDGLDYVGLTAGTKRQWGTTKSVVRSECCPSFKVQIRVWQGIRLGLRLNSLGYNSFFCRACLYPGHVGLTLRAE
jgi:hypothetical protein